MDIPPSRVPIPQELKIVVGYAGFWQRCAASTIDSIVLSIANIPITIVAAVIQVSGSLGLDETVFTIIGYLIPYGITSWLYFALMESSKKQGTLGKMALGIRVTDIDGDQLDFASASVRFFAKIVSVITLYIGFVIAPFTPRKQALHDLIAQTLVVQQERIVPAAFVKDVPIRV